MTLSAQDFADLINEHYTPYLPEPIDISITINGVDAVNDPDWIQKVEKGFERRKQ